MSEKMCEELLGEMIGSHVGIGLHYAIWTKGPDGEPGVGESLAKLASAAPVALAAMRGDLVTDNDIYGR